MSTSQNLTVNWTNVPTRTTNVRLAYRWPSPLASIAERIKMGTWLTALLRA